MNRRVNVSFLVKLALIFLFCISLDKTFAVCLKPNQTVCAQFFHSDVVFIGKVISVTILPENIKTQFNGGWRYHLKVQKVFRGFSRSVIDVTTENDSDRFPLEKGHTYLLFAHLYSGEYWIGDECGHNTDLDENKKIVNDLNKVLEKIQKEAGGNINGVVSEYIGDTSSGIEGVEVIIRGNGKTYATKTDHNGKFDVIVPVGSYTVQAKSSNEKIVAYDLSFNDPGTIRVEKGGCYLVQFVKKDSL